MRMIVSVLLAVWIAGPGWAETRQIVVEGEGVVDSASDMAVIEMGVRHEAETARAAMDRVNEDAGAVLSRLAAMGIAARDLQTRDITLSPVWDQGEDGRRDPARVVGFAASNRILVRVRDLDALGAVLDQVVSDGANQFGGLSFTVQEPGPLMDAARRAAVSDARAKAELLAEAAGVTLGSLISLSESGSPPPRPMMARAEMSDAAVPIAAGEVSFRAGVTMIYEIAP
ncbi:hypothetical protein SAMN04490248_11283 [Salinihabitans flavidus]|uniref:26 kDa periplasmic immunogenic protein n=1 Tax=Salinihabitans flavidus TaxID=569882 RepID=A0A1H8SK48_9RHOB|nr:SIMPL domain-containing protein [Salinihabitans flavidus]SEO79140.1 hypothetical protein SAMN04490248_11283 [Salinihabitans flavidus]